MNKRPPMESPVGTIRRSSRKSRGTNETICTPPDLMPLEPSLLGADRIPPPPPPPPPVPQSIDAPLTLEPIQPPPPKKKAAAKKAPSGVPSSAAKADKKPKESAKKGSEASEKKRTTISANELKALAREQGMQTSPAVAPMLQQVFSAASSYRLPARELSLLLMKIALESTQQHRRKRVLVRDIQPLLTLLQALFLLTAKK